jgi:hypothetical protein
MSMNSNVSQVSTHQLLVKVGVVTASSGVWILAMFKAQDQSPFEPALAIFVAYIPFEAEAANQATATCSPRCCSSRSPS